jgi:tetratricopeptide (TPR) repeat protein
VYGMSEQELYALKTAHLKVFVGDDDLHGDDLAPRRRAKLAGRALDTAEAHLSRLDPLLTDVRLRCAQALHEAGTDPKRLRDRLGSIVREAAVVYGPDALVVYELRRIQSQERPIGGPRAQRKIQRAEDLAERLRDEGGIDYVFAAQDLAELHRRAGSHRRFKDTAAELVRDRTRLGLDEDEQTVFAQLTGASLVEAGEFEQALPLLEEARKRARRESDPWETGFLDVGTAQCQLASGRARDAEAVLRESLNQTAEGGGEDGRHLAKLRHRTVYELGTALFRQDRLDEALDRFQEACDLIAHTANPQDGTFTAYRNTRIYATLRARGEDPS